MQSPMATLHCPNPSCNTQNPEGHKFCQKCGTFLPKHYLWLVGNGINPKATEMIADRYLHKNQGIFIDTRPGLLPEMTEEIPAFIEPYLRLSVHQIHLPQVYGKVLLTSGDRHQEIWLLERIPIQCTQPETVQLRPELTSLWSDASPIRQCNWLWQMAQLWSPFAQVGVASSLLEPRLLRVAGSSVRLLELASDRSTPTLPQLGQFWSGWIELTQPPLRDFLAGLCQQLLAGQVQTAEQLVALLDRALSEVGRSQSRQIQIATLSDRGPSRTRNEDACYPDSGTDRAMAPEGLAIVCDGVGGHEGGDVASGVAIGTIKQRLKPILARSSQYAPESLIQTLEQAAYEANEAIGAQNNSEQRQGRQRMGTTLVMAVTHAHEIYMTHVGDSRAYRIDRSGCYQLTLDDDVASREVRLGYALYRDALQQVASGSLIQALGMGPSSNLHPTIGRFVVDEDCAFLLCSDGLSDYDRVEQNWEEEILPILDGTISVAEAARKLVAIANTENGHDNVTVALLHVRVTPNPSAGISPQSLYSQLESLPSPSPQAASPQPIEEETIEANDMEESTTELLPQPTPSRFPWLLLLLLVTLLAVAGAGLFAYRSMPSWQEQINKQLHRLLGREKTPPPPARVPPAPEPILARSLDPNSAIRMAGTLTLWEQPQEATEGIVREVPPEGILQVVNRQEISGELWLQLQVCLLPGNTEPEPAAASKGNDPPDSDPPSSEPAAPSNSNPPPVSEDKKRPMEEPTEPESPEKGWISANTLDAVGFQKLAALTPQAKFSHCQPPAPLSPTPEPPASPAPSP